MILTITYKGENARDLGYLLHKHPDRAQLYNIFCGKAYVFYPEATDKKTSCSLMLEIDPIELSYKTDKSNDRGLLDHVNDELYISSCFMSLAIGKVFSSALSGNTNVKEELANSKLNLEADITLLPINDNLDLVTNIFKPLGYKISIENVSDKYINLTLKKTEKLSVLLNHLYVLLPVFDKNKYLWLKDTDIVKILSHGTGWLNEHPYFETIMDSYNDHSIQYGSLALEKLISFQEISDTADSQTIVDSIEVKDSEDNITSIEKLRIEKIAEEVLKTGSESVIDIGCGDGKLLSRLLNERQIAKLTGCDVSEYALKQAKQQVNLEHLPDHLKDKLQFFLGSVTYRDKRFTGYEVTCFTDVIEHIEPDLLYSVEYVLFKNVASNTIIITTPNREYNSLLDELDNNGLRHLDHRFEWNREEFKNWCDRICEIFGYRVEISSIGPVDDRYGAPIQMGVFRKWR